jgi:hypothetical protein
MGHPRVVNQFPADLLASQAAQAGCALACSYSSSDEFEAAVIKSKLDAGAYGPKRYRRRRHALWAGIAAGALVFILLML